MDFRFDGDEVWTCARCGRLERLRWDADLQDTLGLPTVVYPQPDSAAAYLCEECGNRFC